MRVSGNSGIMCFKRKEIPEEKSNELINDSKVNVQCVSLAFYSLVSRYPEKKTKGFEAENFTSRSFISGSYM